MVDPFLIPSSRPEHWTDALRATDELAAACPPGHPLRLWRKRTIELLVGGVIPARNKADFAERWMVPVGYLCRLAASLRASSAYGPGFANELKTASNSTEFLHFEHLAALALRIFQRGYRIEVVGKPGCASPDLVVHEHQYAIECRARGDRPPRTALAHDFTHAHRKFAADFGAPSRAGYRGVLALDLGVCGSPDFPDVGRLGPVLDDLEREIVVRLGDTSSLVAAVLVTWTSIGRDPVAGEHAIGPRVASGWITREGLRDLPGVTDLFAPWAQRLAAVAYRALPDGRDPRRAWIPRVDEVWESGHVLRRATAGDLQTFERWIADARGELERMPVGPDFTSPRYEAGEVIQSLQGLFADGYTFVAADERGALLAAVRCRPECLTFVYRPMSTARGLGLLAAAVVVEHLFEANAELKDVTSSRTLGTNGKNLLGQLGFSEGALRRSDWKLRATALAERFWTA